MDLFKHFYTSSETVILIYGEIDETMNSINYFVEHRTLQSLRLLYYDTQSNLRSNNVRHITNKVLLIS